jgi:hypothetical protein
MKVLNDINRGSIGASIISTLFTAQGVKSKGTCTLAIEKAAEVVDNYCPNISTPAMLHGLFNEEEAYKLGIKPKYDDALLQSDFSIKIKEGLHATPDVICPMSELVIDIKCPYSPMTFFQNIDKIKTGYLHQMQCQMLATGFSESYLVYYLTSTNTDEWGNKIEYDIPLEDRVHYHHVTEDEDLQIEMIKRVDEFLQLRDKVIGDIREVAELNDVEFFNICRKKKVTKLKDKHNILAWQGQIIKYDNSYYTFETK